MEEYPECKKWADAHDKILVVSEFLEFLSQKNYRIGKYDETSDRFTKPFIETIMDKTVYEFFGIDEKKLEDERRQILAGIRSKG